jgi:CubicO group peptidase (beta-lactamase class C family)
MGLKLKGAAVPRRAVNEIIRHSIGSILILALALLAPARTSSQEVAMKQRLDAVIDRAIKGERIVGLTALVAKNGEIIYRRTAGWNDREAKEILREYDLFRLASLTKLIVSTAALALVDEGKLNLDDAVTEYLPDFRPKLADGREPTITVRHLLTHTAGLNYGFFEKTDGPYHRLKVSNGFDDLAVSLEENLRRIAAAPLLFEPGTAWNYSVATDVLGAVLAKAGGASLPEVVRRKVTSPLEMYHTEFLAHKRARLVVPYADGDPRPVRMTEPFALNFGGGQIVYSPRRATDATAFPSGGAGMVGTIDDYFRLLEALRNGGAPILKPGTARLIAENAVGETPVAAAGEGWGWSLGLSILKDPIAAKTPQSAGTWQWGGAYGHNYFVDPQKQLTVICLTNTAVAGMTGEFPKALVNAVYGK